MHNNLTKLSSSVIWTRLALLVKHMSIQTDDSNTFVVLTSPSLSSHHHYHRVTCLDRAALLLFKAWTAINKQPCTNITYLAQAARPLSFQLQTSSKVSLQLSVKSLVIIMTSTDLDSVRTIPAKNVAFIIHLNLDELHSLKKTFHFSWQPRKKTPRDFFWWIYWADITSSVRLRKMCVTFLNVVLGMFLNVSIHVCLVTVDGFW